MSAMLGLNVAVSTAWAWMALELSRSHADAGRSLDRLSEGGVDSSRSIGAAKGVGKRLCAAPPCCRDGRFLVPELVVERSGSSDEYPLEGSSGSIIAVCQMYT